MASPTNITNIPIKPEIGLDSLMGMIPSPGVDPTSMTIPPIGNNRKPTIKKTVRLEKSDKNSIKLK